MDCCGWEELEPLIRENDQTIYFASPFLPFNFDDLCRVSKVKSNLHQTVWVVKYFIWPV